MKGFGATSLNDLEMHLGLGRVSLYNAFGDKRRLFLKCLHTYRHAVASPLLQTLDGPDGMQGIRRFFARVVGAPPGIRHRGCLMVNTLVGADGVDRPVGRILEDHVRFVERCFARAVQNGQAQGSIGFRDDPAVIAQMLVVLAHGTFALNRSKAAAGLVEAAVETALKGIECR